MAVAGLEEVMMMDWIHLDEALVAGDDETVGWAPDHPVALQAIVLLRDEVKRLRRELGEKNEYCV